MKPINAILLTIVSHSACSFPDLTLAAQPSHSDILLFSARGFGRQLIHRRLNSSVINLEFRMGRSFYFYVSCSFGLLRVSVVSDSSLQD